MSLAEELLADFEEEEELSPPNIADFTSPADGGRGDEDNKMQVDLPAIADSSSSISNITRLIESEELTKMMKEIEGRLHGSSEFKKLTNKSQIDGPIESHPLYVLVVEANNMAVNIDTEILLIHRFVKERYSRRFPELESLVPSHLEYMFTARELGNDLNRSKNNDKLAEFLTQATIMVVTVTASTTTGRELSPQELASVMEACNMAIELDKMKAKILKFVESHISFIAPNLSVIVGANITAKLMGLAGGLTSLSKMPACNLEILGSQKKNLQGFSSKQSMPHTGFIFQCDLVQSTLPELKRKAARMVAYKCAIVSRVDAAHASPDGSVGSSYRDKIEKSLDKLQEPPPVKQVKALPAPIDQPGKKRGGKRVRRTKERMAMTEFRKQANRINFGEIQDDAYQEDLGFSAGVLGKAGKGRIRAPQMDEKTKVRISKALQKNLQRQQVYGGSTSIRRQVSGTASSVAFTPLQGLEIVNPQAAEAKVNAASAKYFSNTSGFMSVRKDDDA